VISRLFLCRAAKEQFPKASSFGKPKVQVCLFAKRERRASHGRKHCSLWLVSWLLLVERQEVAMKSQHSVARAANFLFLWEEFCGAKFFVRGQTEHPTKPVFYARASVKRRSCLKFSFPSSIAP
jgi:hypothetical protein